MLIPAILVSSQVKISSVQLLNIKYQYISLKLSVMKVTRTTSKVQKLEGLKSSDCKLGNLRSAAAKRSLIKELETSILQIVVRDPKAIF